MYLSVWGCWLAQNSLDEGREKRFSASYSWVWHSQEGSGQFLLLFWGSLKSLFFCWFCILRLLNLLYFSLWHHVLVSTLNHVNLIHHHNFSFIFNSAQLARKINGIIWAPIKGKSVCSTSLTFPYKDHHCWFIGCVRVCDNWEWLLQCCQIK